MTDTPHTDAFQARLIKSQADLAALTEHHVSVQIKLLDEQRTANLIAFAQVLQHQAQQNTRAEIMIQPLIEDIAQRLNY